MIEQLIDSWTGNRVLSDAFRVTDNTVDGSQSWILRPSDPWCDDDCRRAGRPPAEGISVLPKSSIPSVTVRGLHHPTRKLDLGREPATMGP